jgi:hypothetical protein
MNRLALINLSIFFVLLQTNCAHVVSRHPESGYGNPSRNLKKISSVNDNSSNSKELVELQKIAAEIGFNPRSIASEDEFSKIKSKYQIRKAELLLNNQRELSQYNKIVSLFKDEDEQLEFLSLGSFEEKQLWMKQNEVLSRAKQPSAEYASIISNQDIAIGMTEDWVRQSWGEPESVEYSGNPAFKNQKWQYRRFISSTEGYKKENRIVYFEGGKVIGWDSETN